MELLDGSRLIAKEKRGLVEVEGAARKARSVNVHEAEFIRYLDSGTWHLAFYNDGKNTEQVSYNTIIIGKWWLYIHYIMLFTCFGQESALLLVAIQTCDLPLLKHKMLLKHF